MPRVALTPVAAPGKFSTTGITLTETAADASSLNMFSASGDDLVIARNTSADTAYTVTITSTPDRSGRTGNVAALSIPFGTAKMFRLGSEGWAQRGGADAGKIYLQASNAAVKLSVIRLK